MSYVISLDEIDLNYLPLSSYALGEKVKPLFDLRHTKAEDYVEFQIIPSTINDENNNGSTTNTTICWICNLKIPSCYLIEHMQSIKHETFKSIMDNALDRLKNFLKEDNIVNDAQKPPYSYFCDVCCVVLQKNEKENHEKSQHHSEQLKKESQLEDLLCLYSSGTPEDNEHFLTADSKVLSYHVDEEKDELQHNKVFYITKQEPKVETELPSTSIIKTPKLDTSEIKPHEATNLEMIDLTLASGTVIEVSNDNFHGLITASENIMICLLCQEFLENTDKDKSTHISTTNLLSIFHNDAAKIAVYDINCIRMIGNNFYHCILCNEIVTDANSHIINIKHSSAVKFIKSSATFKEAKPLKRKKLLCELCNVVTKMSKYQEHLESSNHLQKMELPVTLHKNNFIVKTANDVIVNNCYQLDINDRNITCKVCKESIPKIGTVTALKHISSVNHVTKYKNTLLFNGISKMADSVDRFSCSVCNQHWILKGIELSHIDSQIHKVLMSKLVADSNLEIPKTNETLKAQSKEVISKLPKAVSPNFKTNKPVSPESELSRTVTPNLESPKTNVPEIDAPKLNSPKIVNPSNPKLSMDELPDGIESTEVIHTVCCKICDVKVPNTVMNVIDQHISSEKHKIKYSDILEQNNIYRIANATVCGVCTDTIDGAKIYCHIKSITHKNNLSKPNQAYTSKAVTKTAQELFVLDKYCTECNFHYNTKPFMSFLHDMNHNIKLHELLKKAVVSEKLYHCSLCNEDVYNDVYNYKTHIVAHMLKTDKTVGFTAEHYCMRCEMDVPKSPIAEDLHQIIHKLSISKLSCQKTDLEKIINTFHALRNCIKTIKRNEYYCDICKTSIANSEVRKYLHNESVEHKENLLRLEKVTGMRSVEEEVHYLLAGMANKKEISCIICEATISNSAVAIIEHFNGKKHKTKYSAILNSNKIKKKGGTAYFCEACNVSLQRTKEIVHTKTGTHLSKLAGEKKSDVKSNYCDLCKVSHPHNSDHYNGKRHKTNLTKQEDSLRGS